MDGAQFRRASIFDSDSKNHLLQAQPTSTFIGLPSEEAILD